MRIRNRLFIFIGGVLAILLISTFTILAKLTSDDITEDLNFQLENQVNALTTQISDLVRTSARSYLTAVGEQSNIDADIYSKEFQKDETKLDEAIKLFGEHMLKIKFMESGYIFLADKNGTILSHPNSSVIGTAASVSPWLKSLNDTEKDFHYYEYKGRQKLLYRVYNKDLGVNICASAYISDFFSSIESEIFHETIQSIKIGRTGYPFILDKDGILISHPNKDLRNKNSLSINDSDGKPFFKTIIDEKEGSFRYNFQDENGAIREKFVSFRYDDISELYVSVTGYVDDFFSTVEHTIFFLTVSGLLMMLIILILIFAVSKSVSSPINIFTMNLKDVSEGDGDLTQRIELKDKSEIGVMVTYFNSFLNTLQSLIGNIKSTADKTLDIKNTIALGVEETSSAIHQISSNIESINSQTTTLNTNIEESAESITKITNNIEDLNNSVESQAEMLETSTAAITEMISSIDNVSKITATKQASAQELLIKANEGATIIENTQNAVQEVSGQLGSIQEIAKIISNIASQTNLLAMNAAIEAAHAGDAGKGFAVVADEIRKLAENSSMNSSKISEVLKVIGKSIFVADDLSKNTKTSFSLINSEITSIADALKEIDLSTSELQIGGKDILDSIIGLESASVAVKEKSLEIRSESEGVNNSMENTRQVTMGVVGAIEEISIGTKDIYSSMNEVQKSTNDLAETGRLLSDSVNKFKT